MVLDRLPAILFTVLAAIGVGLIAAALVNGSESEQASNLPPRSTSEPPSTLDTQSTTPTTSEIEPRTTTSIAIEPEPTTTTMPPDPAPSSSTEAPPERNLLGGDSPEDGLMPDLVCFDLQAAQDEVQDHGVFFSRSEDASGEGRRQLWDRNWVVVDQDPAPGIPIGEGDAVFYVLKDDEPHGCDR